MFWKTRPKYACTHSSTTPVHSMCPCSPHPPAAADGSACTTWVGNTCRGQPPSALVQCSQDGRTEQWRRRKIRPHALGLKPAPTMPKPLHQTVDCQGHGPLAGGRGTCTSVSHALICEGTAPAGAGWSSSAQALVAALVFADTRALLADMRRATGFPEIPYAFRTTAQ